MDRYGRNAEELRGIPISFTPPTDGQVLTYDAADNTLHYTTVGSTAVVGYHYETLALSAAAGIIPMSGAAALISQDELANGIDLLHAVFYNGERLQFLVALPDGWDNGLVGFKIGWTTFSYASGNVTWEIYGVRFQDGNLMSALSPTLIGSTTDTSQGTHYYNETSEVSGDIQITPGAGKTAIIEVGRAVSDTLADQASLLVLKLRFKVANNY